MLPFMSTLLILAESCFDEPWVTIFMFNPDFVSLNVLDLISCILYLSVFVVLDPPLDPEFDYEPPLLLFVELFVLVLLLKVLFVLFATLVWLLSIVLLFSVEFV